LAEQALPEIADAEPASVTVPGPESATRLKGTEAELPGAVAARKSGLEADVLFRAMKSEGFNYA